MEIDISGGSYTIVNCDAAVEGMIEDWIAKSGPSVQVTYGRSPVIKYTGTMHAWGDSPAEERFRQETELRLMSAAGEELVGWAIEVPTARPNGSSSSNIRRIGVVKEYVGFRLFAKSDFHLVDFGGVGRSWGVEEISLQTARDDGLMGMVSFDSKVGWMLVGLPGTARVARAMSPTSPTGSQPDGSLWPRTASVVFEQPTTPPSHRSLIGSRQLSMVSMGSEESQQSSSVESLHAAGSDALAATAQPPPPGHKRRRGTDDAGPARLLNTCVLFDLRNSHPRASLCAVRHYIVTWTTSIPTHQLRCGDTQKPIAWPWRVRGEWTQWPRRRARNIAFAPARHGGNRTRFG